MSRLAAAKSACPPIFSIDDYPFARDDRLFLDTSVWLCPHEENAPPSERAIIYMQAIPKMLAAGCQLYTNLLVLSEYTNRRARMEWKKHREGTRKFRDFKKFRESEEFRSVAKGITSDTEEMISHCRLVDLDDGNLDIATVRACLTDYQAGKLDFNDAVIVQICRAYGLKLVTDDADFAHQKIPVITGNPILLANDE